MKVWDFVRPTFLKVILAIVLFFVFSLLWGEINVMFDATTFGFPFTVSAANGFCGPIEFDPTCGQPVYNFSGIILNAVFWYLVSAGILSLWNKEK